MSITQKPLYIVVASTHNPRYNISKMREVYAIELECINEAFGTAFTDPDIAWLFFTTWAETQQNSSPFTGLNGYSIINLSDSQLSIPHNL